MTLFLWAAVIVLLAALIISLVAAYRCHDELRNYKQLFGTANALEGKVNQKTAELNDLTANFDQKTAQLNIVEGKLVTKNDYASYFRALTSPITVQNALVYGQQELEGADKVRHDLVQNNIIYCIATTVDVTFALYSSTSSKLPFCLSRQTELLFGQLI